MSASPPFRQPDGNQTLQHLVDQISTLQSQMEAKIKDRTPLDLDLIGEPLASANRHAIQRFGLANSPTQYLLHDSDIPRLIRKANATFETLMANYNPVEVARVASFQPHAATVRNLSQLWTRHTTERAETDQLVRSRLVTQIEAVVVQQLAQQQQEMKLQAMCDKGKAEDTGLGSRIEEADKEVLDFLLARGRVWMDEGESDPELSEQVLAVGERVDEISVELRASGKRHQTLGGKVNSLGISLGDHSSRLAAARKYVDTAHTRISGLERRLGLAEDALADQKDDSRWMTRKEVRDNTQAEIKAELQRFLQKEVKQIMATGAATIKRDSEVQLGLADGRLKKETRRLEEIIERQKEEAIKSKKELDTVRSNLAGLKLQADDRAAKLLEQLEVQRAATVQADKMQEELAQKIKGLEEELVMTQEQKLARRTESNQLFGTRHSAASAAGMADSARDGQEVVVLARNKSSGAQHIEVEEERERLKAAWIEIVKAITATQQTALEEIAQHWTTALDIIVSAQDDVLSAIDERATLQLAAIGLKSDKLDLTMLAFEDRHSVTPVIPTVQDDVTPSIPTTLDLSCPLPTIDQSQVLTSPVHDLSGSYHLVPAASADVPSMTGSEKRPAAQWILADSDAEVGKEDFERLSATDGADLPKKMSKKEKKRERERLAKQASKGKGAEKAGPKGKKMSRMDAELAGAQEDFAAKDDADADMAEMARENERERLSRAIGRRRRR